MEQMKALGRRLVLVGVPVAMFALTAAPFMRR